MHPDGQTPELVLYSIGAGKLHPDTRQMAVDNEAEVWVGVLALQGAFREHLACLRRLPGVHAVEVRTKEQLASVDGLIIPGGAVPRVAHALVAAGVPAPCTEPA